MSNQTLPDFYSIAKSKIDKPTQEPMDFYALARPNKQTDVPEQPIEAIPEAIQPSEESTIGQRAKNYFTKNKFGEALNIQMKSGGFSGAPALEPKVAKKVAIEVGTIAAMEAVFAPIYGVAAASKYAPRVLKAITRLTQAGTTGAAVATTSNLADKGELPSQEELVKNGLEWAAVDAIMQALHVTATGGKFAYDFGKAVNDISKKDNIPKTQVLSKLWDSTKNYIRQKYGRVISKPEDIKTRDVEILVKEAKKAEKEGLKTVIEVEPVVEKPIEPIIEKPATPEIKPTKDKKIAKEAIPWEGIDNLLEIQRHMYQTQLDRIQAHKEGKNVDATGWEMPPLGAIYSDLADAHYLPPKIQEYYAKLAKEQLFEEAKNKAVKAMDAAEKEESNLQIYKLNKPVTLNKPEDINIGWNVGKKSGEPFAVVKILGEVGLNEIILNNEEKKLINKYVILDRNAKDGFTKLLAKNAKQEAQEKIFERIHSIKSKVKQPAKPIEEKPKKQLTKNQQKTNELGKDEFKTAKGSIYKVEGDSTIRNKAPRPEHPGELGLQPKSDRTFYVKEEDVNKLAPHQATHPKGVKTRVERSRHGEIGVFYIGGPNDGRVINSSQVPYTYKPQIGYIPVEVWKGGEKVHFGNVITEIGKTQVKETSKVTEKPIITKVVIEQPKSSDKPSSGYERKPTPKTVDEKIAHLSQKIKDSEDYSTNLKLAIAEQKDLIEALQTSKTPDKLKLNLAKQNLSEKRNELKSEQDYSRKLKSDLKDLKAKREGSKVEVPLGREADTRRGQRTPPAITRPKKPIMGKKQAAKRSDILKLFRKAFNDPIRLGKFRQRALGIHKGWAKVSRLLNDNDIETAAHEIGHNLHYTLYGGDAKNPNDMRTNTTKALMPYLKELKELAHYEPYTLEGFAEFTRMYVTNPDAAKALAPKFYEKFENDLEAGYPELKNALLEAREYYDTYLEGTPESRIDAQLNFAQDESKLKSMIDWIKNSFNLDNLKTEFLDDVFPAKRLVAEAFGIALTEVESLKDERNLYRSLRVLKGGVGKGDVFLKYETFDPDTLERTGEGLRDIIKDLPNENAYREFNRFLVARRAIEKYEQSIDTGINQGDAVQVYNQYKDQYGDLAKRLDAYNNHLLLYAKKSGLLSEDQYKAIKKNNMAYAPFQRVMTPEKSGGAQGTSGRIQAGKPIKRMTGSTRDIIAPLESVIKNTYAIIINAEKNRAGQVLGKIAEMQNIGKYVERVPAPLKLQAKISKEEVLKSMEKELKRMGWFGDTDIGSTELHDFAVKLADIMPDFFLRFGAGIYPAGENIITVFYDGKPAYFEVSPDLYEMWSKGMAPYTSNILTKILRAPARLLRAGAILNPKFIQKNFIRDTWGSWLFTKYGKSIKDPSALFIDTIYQPLSMLAQAAKKSPLYVEWLKSGGGMSTMQSLDRQSVLKHIEEVKKNFKPYQIIKMLRAVAEISEEANRLSEFSRALEVEGRTRLGREIAAFAARDLSIDFAKMGLQTKALNQIIPFFNATVQGGDKLIRMLADPEARKQFIPRLIGFILIPSLILAWLNQYDEDVKELQEQEKDFNFVTKIGKNILKIPVPFETGVLVHGLTQRMYQYFVNKDQEAFEGFMGSIAEASLPSFIPSFANPFIEVQANKNFFTGGRIIPSAQEKLTSKYQYKTYTSLTARLLGRAMNYMLGEDTRYKAASPAIIDHFINSWSGGLGRLMVSISDSALQAVGLGDKIPKPEQTIIEKLGLDAFTARYPRANTHSIEKFYDNYQDAIARVTSKEYAKKQDLSNFEEIEKAEQRIDKLYDVRTLKRAYKAIQMCQREINNIMIAPDITSEEKRQMVDELYLQMIDFAKAANKDILEYRSNH